VDHQVKLRGFRIELGEVENALRQNADVTDALVVLKGGRLVAYVIPDQKGSGTQAKLNILRSELASRLPEYMIPSTLLWLDDFPRTPNGKIDRKSLPEPVPVESESPSRYEPPQTETQQKIQEIWSNLLGVKQISMQDDFFALGGHSLLMIQLISRLRQVFNFSIPLNAIVDTRTIASQAMRIDTLRWSREVAQSNKAAVPGQAAREEFEV
jgi:acyl carrier protein